MPNSSCKLKTPLCMLSSHDTLSHPHSHYPLQHVPYLNIQVVCSDLRWIHAHLKTETKPSKTLTTICNVKCNLNAVIITRDGLTSRTPNWPTATIQGADHSTAQCTGWSCHCPPYLPRSPDAYDHEMPILHPGPISSYQPCMLLIPYVSLQKFPTKHIEQSSELSI